MSDIFVESAVYDQASAEQIYEFVPSQHNDTDTVDYTTTDKIRSKRQQNKQADTVTKSQLDVYDVSDVYDDNFHNIDTATTEKRKTNKVKHKSGANKTKKPAKRASKKSKQDYGDEYDTDIFKAPFNNAEIDITDTIADPFGSGSVHTIIQSTSKLTLKPNGTTDTKNAKKGRRNKDIETRESQLAEYDFPVDTDSDVGAPISTKKPTTKRKAGTKKKATSKPKRRTKARSKRVSDNDDSGVDDELAGDVPVVVPVRASRRAKSNIVLKEQSDTEIDEQLNIDNEAIATAEQHAIDNMDEFENDEEQDNKQLSDVGEPMIDEPLDTREQPTPDKIYDVIAEPHKLPTEIPLEKTCTDIDEHVFQDTNKMNIESTKQQRKTPARTASKHTTPQVPTTATGYSEYFDTAIAQADSGGMSQTDNLSMQHFDLSHSLPHIDEFNISDDITMNTQDSYVTYDDPNELLQRLVRSSTRQRNKKQKTFIKTFQDMQIQLIHNSLNGMQKLLHTQNQADTADLNQLRGFASDFKEKLKDVHRSYDKLRRQKMNLDKQINRLQTKLTTDESAELSIAMLRISTAVSKKLIDIHKQYDTAMIAFL